MVQYKQTEAMCTLDGGTEDTTVLVLLLLFETQCSVSLCPLLFQRTTTKK